VNKELKTALLALNKEAKDSPRPSPFVVTSERDRPMSAAVIVNKFAGWYRALGFVGASSHSGRRTFITNAARRISTVGGSLRDVQLLAGHSALGTTQRYIEADGMAQRRIVELV
jgi:integrase/recombinase XerD